MRIKSLLLGASALMGLSVLFGSNSSVAAAVADTLAMDVGGGTPAIRTNRGGQLAHRRWKKARAAGRHNFRKSL